MWWLRAREWLPLSLSSATNFALKLPTELVRFASSLNVPVSTMSVGRYVPLRPVNQFSLRNYSSYDIAINKTTLRTMWRWVKFDLEALHSLRQSHHSVKVHVHLWTGFFIFQQNYTSNKVATFQFFNSLCKTTLRKMWRWVKFDLVVLHTLRLIHHSVKFHVPFMPEFRK